MSQVERGGQNVQRWPAEFPETDNPEGTVGEEMRDRDAEDSERMAALPEHEQDPNDAVGAGVMSTGGTAADHGGDWGDQPVPGEEGEAVPPDTDDYGGLPAGDTDR